MEHLDTASNQEASSRLDRVALEDVPPSCLSRCLKCDGFGDDSVQSLDLSIILRQICDARQHLQTLLGAVMRCEPSGRLRNKKQEEENGEEDNALQNGGDSPRIAASVVHEAVVDPVDEEDAEIQSRELCTDENATACLGAELGLHDGHCRVDYTQTDSRDNPADNEMRSAVCGSLQNRAEYADDSARGHALATTKLLAKYCCSHGTDEATDCIPMLLWLLLR